MGDYAMLLKLTDHGRRVLKDPVRFMNQVEEAWKAIEGEARVYLMMGEYDFLVVASAPRPEDVVALALEFAKSGDVSASTTCIHPPHRVAELPHIKPSGGSLHFDIEPI
jgi:uncharacterized protein with GYD domain